METLTELEEEKEEEKGKDQDQDLGQVVRRKRKTLNVREKTYNKLRELGRYGDSASEGNKVCQNR